MDRPVLALPGRTPGSYDRAAFQGSLLQRKLNHLGLFFSIGKAVCVFRDENARRLWAPGDVAAYEEEVSAVLRQTPLTREGSNEDVCRLIFRLRVRRLGNGPVQAEYPRKSDPLPVTALDQRDLCETLWRKSAVVFYLSEPRFAPSFRQDAIRASRAGKSVFVLSFPGDPALPEEKTLRALLGDLPVTYLPVPDSFGCADLSRVPDRGGLLSAVERGDVFFCGYGEDALLSARKLALPAEITVLPQGMPARALTGLFTRPGPCRLYVPAGFDPIPGAPLTEKTKLCYFQLAALAERFGESVYGRSPEDLAKRDPGLFYNIYDDHLPPRREAGFSLAGASLEAARRTYLTEKLNRLPGVRYLTGSFDPETLENHPMDYDLSAPQNRILVDGVLLSPGTATRIYPGGAGERSPRSFFFDRREPGTAILSNFAFFFTEKLAAAYDLLRQDRPKERLSGPAGYVDFRRYTDGEGQVHESFPLYGKACLAAKKSGGYTAFRFELGGGSVTLNGLTLRWECPNDPTRDVTVFTPMLTRADEEEDPAAYRKAVGAGRCNLVFVGDSLLAIRRGDVLLPPMGAVLSVAGDAEKAILSLLGKADKDGYYDPSPLAVSIRPDPPANVSASEWADFAWIYGGGLCLMDGSGAITRENFLPWCRREGWLSPLSRQTQESSLHTLARHPRTGVGVTGEGELFLLVFSGRSNLSLGADYVEMAGIARKLVPDIRFFINWDGGGSSVLGLAEGDTFTEISLPAPSDDSIMGMARPIHSMLLAEPKREP